MTALGPGVPSLRFLRPTPSCHQYLSARVGFYFLFYFVLTSFVTHTSRPDYCEEKIMIRPRHDQLSRLVWSRLSLSLAGGLSFLFLFSGGHSMPGQEEDISPYATFHLLGMREEAKAAAAGKNE